MKPFRVSYSYIEWAHGPGAEDGQPLALRIVDAPFDKGHNYVLFTDPELVAEIASVAELYVGGRRDDNDLRAARALKRARAWLKEAALDKVKRHV